MWRENNVTDWIKTQSAEEVQFEQLMGFPVCQDENDYLAHLHYKHANQRFIVQIPNGYVMGPFGIVLTPDMQALKESSINHFFDAYMKNHIAQTLLKVSTHEMPLIKIEGAVAVIASAWYYSYYHWMVDIIPRLQLLKDANIHYDKLITNKLEFPYQFETLATLGIDLDKIVQCPEDSFFQADTLIFPSFINRYWSPRLEVLRWVENLYPNTKRPERRIYVSRNKCASRRLLNEEELMPVLAEFNIERVYLESLSIQEQSTLFGTVSFMMGVHGAGFTNMIFAPKNAQILEFLDKDHQEYEHFLYMAVELGHSYRCALTDPEASGSDVIISPTRLRRILNSQFSGKNKAGSSVLPTPIPLPASITPPPKTSAAAAAPDSDLMQLIHKQNIYHHFDATRLPKNIQGWRGDDALFSQLIEQTKPKLIVEVGTWKGMSAIHMAKNIQRRGLDTKIVCIDTWLGAFEFWIGDNRGTERDLMQTHGYPMVYYQFLTNVVQEGLQDIIIPFPVTSNIGASFLKHYNIKADLIYVDGSHEYQDVKNDIYQYTPLLRDANSILFGDDYNWDGVKKAVDEVLGAKARIIHNAFWVYENTFTEC